MSRQIADENIGRSDKTKEIINDQDKVKRAIIAGTVLAGIYFFDKVTAEYENLETWKKASHEFWKAFDARRVAEDDLLNWSFEVSKKAATDSEREEIEDLQRNYKRSFKVTEKLINVALMIDSRA